jgi:hypothetical protein
LLRLLKMLRQCSQSRSLPLWSPRQKPRRLLAILPILCRSSQARRQLTKNNVKE